MIIFHKNDQYNWLGTFSNHQVTLDDITWKTAEHYYQAQRFIYFPDLYHQIKESKTTDTVYRFVHEFASLTQKHWNSEKLGIREKVMRVKFDQHADLKQMLIETNDELLVCRTEDKSFWGTGLDGHGQNQLGKLVMSLRTEYQAEVLCAV
jgi:hypothetical protein